MSQGTSRGSMSAFLVAHLDARVAARFWVKVDKNGPIPEHRPDLGPCWVWTRATDPKGYGRFGIGRRVFFAHRVALALTGEVPPDDLMACHHCDNPPCCNPAHLFLGTAADNLGDMAAKGRNHTDECANGHPRNAENAHVYSGGKYDLYRCRACDRDRSPAKKARKQGLLCTVPECGKPLAQKGMCWMHYERDLKARKQAMVGGA